MIKTNFFLYLVLIGLVACKNKHQTIEEAPLISDFFFDSDSVKHKIQQTKPIVLWSPNHILLAKELNPDSILINPNFPDSIFPYFKDSTSIQNYFFVYDSDDETPPFLNPQNRTSFANLRTLALEDILFQLKLFGKIFTKEKLANRMADSLSLVKQNIQQSLKDKKNIKVAMLLNYEPLRVAGSGSYLQQMMDICHFQNVFADKQEASADITIQELIQKKPDYLFIISEDTQFGDRLLQMHSQTYTIPAIQNERVAIFSPKEFLNSDKECFAGLYQMARFVYPTIIEPFDSLTKSLPKTY